MVIVVLYSIVSLLLAASKIIKDQEDAKFGGYIDYSEITCRLSLTECVLFPAAVIRLMHLHACRRKMQFQH